MGKIQLVFLENKTKNKNGMSKLIFKIKFGNTQKYNRNN